MMKRVQYHTTSPDRLQSIKRSGLKLPKRASDVSTHRYTTPSISTADDAQNASAYHPSGLLLTLSVKPGAKYLKRSIRMMRKGEHLEKSVNRWLKEVKEKGADGFWMEGMQSTVGNQTINPKVLIITDITDLSTGESVMESNIDKMIKRIREGYAPRTAVDGILIEKITMKDVKKLRTELKMFMKNVKRIRSGKQLKEVGEAFNNWITYVENYFYQRIGGFGFDKPREFTDKQRRDTWELIILNGHIFDTKKPRNWSWRDAIKDGRWYSFDDAFRDEARREAPGRNPTLDDEKRFYDYLYDLWSKERNYHYGVLQRAGKKAMDAIEDAFDDLSWDKPEGIQDLHARAVFRVAGLPVEVRYPEDMGGVDGAAMEKRGVAAVKKLDQVLKLLKKKNLGHTVKGVKRFVADVQERTNAGHYEIGTREVHLEAWGTFGDLTVKVWLHEIGHHQWMTQFGERQKDDWGSFIKGGKTTFTDAEWDVVEKAIKEAINKTPDEKMQSWSTENWFIQDVVTDKIPALIKDPVIKRKFEAANESDLGLYLNWLGEYPDLQKKVEEAPTYPAGKKEHADIYCQAARRKNVGASFLLNKITAYSNKNSEEAYSETLALYLLGKKLPEAVVRMFKSLNGIL